MPGCRCSCLKPLRPQVRGPQSFPTAPLTIIVKSHFLIIVDSVSIYYSWLVFRGGANDLFVDNHARSCYTMVKPPTESDVMCQKESIHKKSSKFTTHRVVYEPFLQMLAPFPAENARLDKIAWSSVATVEEKKKLTVFKWRDDAGSRQKPW